MDQQQHLQQTVPDCCHVQLPFSYSPMILSRSRSPLH